MVCFCLMQFISFFIIIFKIDDTYFLYLSKFHAIFNLSKNFVVFGRSNLDLLFGYVIHEEQLIPFHVHGKYVLV
jgi:hypothetical protein